MDSFRLRARKDLGHQRHKLLDSFPDQPRECASDGYRIMRFCGRCGGRGFISRRFELLFSVLFHDPRVSMFVGPMQSPIRQRSAKSKPHLCSLRVSAAEPREILKSDFSTTMHGSHLSIRPTTASAWEPMPSAKRRFFLAERRPLRGSTAHPF